MNNERIKKLTDIITSSALPEEKKIKAMNYFNDVAYNLRQDMEYKMGNRPITNNLKDIFNTAVESATLFYVNHEMQENNATSKCMWYNVSRNQRAAELERKAGLDGTKNYKSMGCYSCDGFKDLCDYRLDSKDFTDKPQGFGDLGNNPEGYMNGQW